LLTPAELKAIWQATGDGSAYSSIVRLLLLSGQRKAEVGGLAWPELDRGNALIVLSGARTKNGKPHEVPLSRQALRILRDFPELPDRPYIFGRDGRSPFSGWSRCKERMDARIAAQAPRWPHGRFTICAGRSPPLCAEHELVEPHVIEAILNHVSGHKNGVAGIYNRATYREPKRIGLQAWADWLETIAAGAS
jgi:integrase